MYVHIIYTYLSKRKEVTRLASQRSGRDAFAGRGIEDFSKEEANGRFSISDPLDWDQRTAYI